MTWVKGQSGNPAGKVPETESKTAKLRRLIDARIPEIINTLIEGALSGDVQAAKILIDRAIPTLRSESLPVNLTLPDKASLSDIGRSIIQSISDGSISADQGAQLMSALTRQARLIEVTELERRIEQLEQSQSKQE